LKKARTSRTHSRKGVSHNAIRRLERRVESLAGAAERLKERCLEVTGWNELLGRLLPQLEGEEVVRSVAEALTGRLRDRPWLLLVPELGIVHGSSEPVPPDLLAEALLFCGDAGPLRERLLVLLSETPQAAPRPPRVLHASGGKEQPEVLLIVSGPRAFATREVGDLLRLARAAFARSARYAKARELETMQAYFVSMVSHEFRTPLSTLRGSIENLIDGMAGAVSAEQRDYLLMMQQGVDNLVHLVDNVLDLARLELGRDALDLGEVALPELLRPAGEGYRVLAERKGVAFEMRCPPDLPAVQGDAQRLLQVFTNLVGNAVKYTGAGGRVTLQVEALDPDEVRVSVADTGVGIDVKDQARIFDRFFRVDSPDRKREKGMGLGLAIAKEVVERHRGRIWVESAPGQGSTFRFTIPMARVAGEVEA